MHVEGQMCHLNFLCICICMMLNWRQVQMAAWWPPLSSLFPFTRSHWGTTVDYTGHRLVIPHSLPRIVPLPDKLFSWSSPLILAPYVGCRRVVLLPKRRHSVSCWRHVADMFQSCRIHKKMSCRQGVQNDTTFDDCQGIPDMSVISWLLFELKHKNSMIAKVPVCLGWFVLVGNNWYKLGMSGPLLCRNDTQCRPRFGDICTCRRHRHVGVMWS